jgi:histidinol-phosphate phosphatase family protein
MDVNRSLIGSLEKHGVSIKQVYFCPHTKEDNCKCRKPNAYFIEKAEKDYGLDIKNSYIIGDHPSDIEISLNIEINTIYILCGHGNKHFDQLKVRPDHIADDLYDAAIWINKRKGGD